MACRKQGYVSCIKIQGVHILPPLITEEERNELLKYKLKAIEIERRIEDRKKRVEEALRTPSVKPIVLVESVSEDSKIRKVKRQASPRRNSTQSICFGASNHIAASSASSCSNIELQENCPLAVMDPMDDLEAVSREDLVCPKDCLISPAQNKTLEDTMNDTWKVINFVMKASTDLTKNIKVQEFQEMVFNELLKQRGLDKALKRSDSRDTLHNIENLADDRGVSSSETLLEGKENEFQSDDEKENRPEVNEVMVETPSLPEFSSSVEPSSSQAQEPRRNSYTLDSPSPTVLAYLKSIMTEKMNSLKTKGVVKNLNSMWDIGELNFNKTLKESLPVDSSPSDLCGIMFDANQNSVFPARVSSPKKPKKRLPVVTMSPEVAAVKVQAHIRGYLVRRLFKTKKVAELKDTVKESLAFALSLHIEETTASSDDFILYVRLIRQIAAACKELHNIFVEYTIPQRMAIIQQDRTKLLTPRLAVPRSLPSSRSSLKTSSHSKYFRSQRTLKERVSAPVTPTLINKNDVPLRPTTSQGMNLTQQRNNRISTLPSAPVLSTPSREKVKPWR